MEFAFALLVAVLACGRVTSLRALGSNVVQHQAQHTIKKHREMTLAQCDSISSIRGFQVCKDVADGTVWPDCPTANDNLYNRDLQCLAGSVPVHQGAAEMLKQGAAGVLSALGLAKLDVHSMSLYRTSIQHHHASPLLPLHLKNPDRKIATVTNRQVRDKIVQQSMEWHCKSMHWAKLYSEHSVASADNHHLMSMTGFHFGKILHIVQDSFSMSHTLRGRHSSNIDNVIDCDLISGLEEAVAKTMSCLADGCSGLPLLQNHPIVMLLSMDDVSWPQHVHYDDVKGNTCKDRYGKAMNDLASIATRRVLNVFDKTLEKGGKISPGDEKALLHRLATVLCDEVMLFADINEGAGGSVSDISKKGLSWKAQLPKSASDKQMVKAKLESIIADIRSRQDNRAFRLPVDWQIPYWYPTADEGDFCKIAKMGHMTCSESFPRGLGVANLTRGWFDWQ